MKFVKGILLLQLSSICQALFNSATQAPPTNSSEVQDGNITRLEEEVKVNPYIKHLSGKCTWTLKMPENSSFDVAVDAELADRLVLQICQGLGCGGVYNVTKIKRPSNSSCFSECHFETGNLQNCSLQVAQDCVVISEAVCGAHMVRLSGGWDRCAGRVELWRGGQWGSVCDDEFDRAEAEVVCRQVGCGYALKVSGQGGLFPPGTGPVLLDDLNCTGTEPNLWDCPGTEETDCGHKEDAGVVCSEMKAVRLSGGLDRCSGKVEIHRNGTWGTVCDTCWNSDIASVICSMLQCGPFPANISGFKPSLIHNPGPLYYYACPLNFSLWDCRELVNKTHMCMDSKAAGVICNGSLGFPNATTAIPQVTTTQMVTDVSTLAPDDSSLLSSLLLLSLASVSLLLLVFLIVNTVLCCLYKSRNAFLVQQSHMSQSSKSKPRRNSYEESVNLTKVSSNPAHGDVSTRPLWMQLSNVDCTSVETDSFAPSFSTFHNSQRHRADRNPPMMSPLGLDHLHEEAFEPAHRPVGAFSSYNGANFKPKSRITSDSFDSSSTSSEETYKNTNHYIEKQNYEEEDEGPVYSPVSPESETSSEDDYDDVGTA